VESKAIIIPCYNEEITVRQVILDCKKYIPKVEIFVYDNNSTDNTYNIAKNENVNVIKCPEQGKGNVLKQAFKELDFDRLLMVDGDDTYPIEEFQTLLQYNEDLIIGDRLTKDFFHTNQKTFHKFGNKLVLKLFNLKYKTNLTDIMSGMRILNKNFYKQLNLKYGGFEVETEMNIFAVKNNFSIRSIPISYKERPKGSFSKINTIKDGCKIIKLCLFS
jgi:glycosyltransferase involved in cell wall biosynthesis